MSEQPTKSPIHPAMRRVKCEVRTGELVTWGQIPKFNIDPEILLWGERLFRLHRSDADAAIYREAFSSALIMAGDEFAPPPPPAKETVDTACGVAETMGGTPLAEHTDRVPGGQQKDYLVLTEEERAKGFKRPVRRSYVHEKCGATTTMNVALAETYARCPDFYSGTFCCRCGDHFPVGEKGEFVWHGTTEKVGT